MKLNDKVLVKLHRIYINLPKNISTRVPKTFMVGGGGKKTIRKAGFIPPVIHSPTEFFTDASIMAQGYSAQIGVGLWHVGGHESWRLTTATNQKADINHAELGALLIAVLRLPHGNNRITIFTDSLTSIKVLRGDISCEQYEPLVRCIRHIVDDYPGSITFAKVKGHSGVVGNENADFLARYAINSPSRVFWMPEDVSTHEYCIRNPGEVIEKVRRANGL